MTAALSPAKGSRPDTERVPRAGRLARSRVWQHFRSNRTAIVAVGVIAVLVILAIVGPWITPYDPDKQELLARLQTPSGEHWLGTDSFGRDILSRLLASARTTLVAVVQAVSVGMLLGIPLGVAAGMARGWVDAILSRIADALMTVPPLVLALAAIGVLGPGLTNAMIAVGIVLSPNLFRLARASAQSVSEELYIEACRAAGCSRWRLLWRHLLPNASSPLLVEITFAAGAVITAEASLSFLGIGAQPPQVSWGLMLREAFDQVHEAEWQMTPPAIMIVLTILSFAMAGDGLRDAVEGKTHARLRRPSRIGRLLGAGGKRRA
jgi:peptide/nickel transport system permease protein